MRLPGEPEPAISVEQEYHEWLARNDNYEAALDDARHDRHDDHAPALRSPLDTRRTPRVAPTPGLSSQRGGAPSGDPSAAPRLSRGTNAQPAPSGVESHPRVHASGGIEAGCDGRPPTPTRQPPNRT